MLVLSRKPGRRILIGDDVIVELVDVQRGKIRLGITAPPHVSVDRSEVREAKTNHPRAEVDHVP